MFNYFLINLQKYINLIRVGCVIIILEGGDRMYEFSSKEVRSKFKETEYGKKTNKLLYTFLTITLSYLVLSFVFGFLCGAEIINISEKTVESILTVVDGLFYVFLIITCYFDGKRDGAIEQFKRSLKQKK